jgi:hypothetical protein
MSDTNTTLRPESPLNKPRQDGFYWVKLSEDFDWEIAFFLQRFGWQRTGCRNANVDHDFTEIDERRIVRKEPVTHKISGTTERTPQNE